MIVVAPPCLGNREVICGGTGLLNRLSQSILSHVLNAAVGETDVASGFLPCGGPRNRNVRLEFQQTSPYRNTGNGKIIVAGKKHLRIRFIGVQIDEVTNFAVVEITREVGCAGAPSISWAP